MRLPLFLSFHITLGGLTAALFSFAGWNTAAAYRSAAAVYLLAGVAMGEFSPFWRRFVRHLRNSPVMVSCCFGGGGLLALSLRPLEEGDSLYNLHYVTGWVKHAFTPYTFSYNYVPFWDLGAVPALVLTRSDYFFWFHALQPVLLLAAGLWRISRELQLPSRMAGWTIAAVCTFPHLWLGPSGVSTNKNDMIHAAGYALLALVAARWARGKTGWENVVCAGMGAMFVSVKGSGPVMLIAAAVAVSVTAWHWIRRNPGKTAWSIGVMALIWFAGAGHYYLHNYLVYANPVYPYQVNLGPLHLPGRADQSATSIAYSLHDPDVYRFLFLPEGGLSPAGTLFPVVLPAILGCSLVWALGALKRKRCGVAQALGIFQVLAWAVYFRSVYSASGAPGDLAFLRNDLNSTRYVEGPLLVGMLSLVWLLHRWRVPHGVIYALLAVQALGCAAILGRRAPDLPWVAIACCGGALALSAACFRGKMAAFVAAAVVIASMPAGTFLVERRRPLLAQQLQPLYLPLYDLPPREVFYVLEDEFSPQTCWHWLMQGRRLQHSWASGGRDVLAARVRKPDYVAWVRRSPDEAPMNLPDFEVLVETPRGQLLKRR